MALQAPRAAEADVGQADGTPGEDGAEAAEGLQPDEDVGFPLRRREEGEQPNDRGDADGFQRPAAAVNVGEELGSLALLRQSAESARGAVDARIADGEDGDHDDDVHDRVEAVDACVFDGDDERRGFGVYARLTDQSWVGVWDQEPHEEKRDDVEEADAPEDLLHGRRQGSPGVGSLRRRKAYKFGALDFCRQCGLGRWVKLIQNSRILPVKANAAMTNTEQRPLKPLLKA